MVKKGKFCNSEEYNYKFTTGRFANDSENIINVFKLFYTSYCTFNFVNPLKIFRKKYFKYKYFKRYLICCFTKSLPGSCSWKLIIKSYAFLHKFKRCDFLFVFSYFLNEHFGLLIFLSYIGTRLWEEVGKGKGSNSLLCTPLNYAVPTNRSRSIK